MTGRSIPDEANKYRFGFNGMEKNQKEELANNDTYTTHFRQYNPAIVRWMSIDPKPNAEHSKYISFGNNPILNIDPLGDTIYVYSRLDENGSAEYTQKELKQFVNVSQALDKKNGINSVYHITTQEELNSDKFTFDPYEDFAVQYTTSTADVLGFSLNILDDNGLINAVIYPNQASQNPVIYGGLAATHEIHLHGISMAINRIFLGNIGDYGYNDHHADESNKFLDSDEPYKDFKNLKHMLSREESNFSPHAKSMITTYYRFLEMRKKLPLDGASFYMGYEFRPFLAPKKVKHGSSLEDIKTPR